MNIKTKTYKIHDARFSKELSGTRMALFSDSHNGYFGENGNELVEIFRKAGVKTLLFAGDANNTFKNSDDPSRGYSNVLELFKSLAGEFDVYFANGNHEERWKKLCLTLTEDGNYYLNTRKEMEEAGVHFLDNESVSLFDGRVKIFGLNLPLDYYTKNAQNPTVEYLQSLLGKPDDNAYNILLAHSPKFYENYGEWGANLVLSGHIHGGLIRLPFIGGLLSPYRTFFPKYDYGYFENDICKMIVSSGCGDHNLREKISNPLEVVIIELI